MAPPRPEISVGAVIVDDGRLLLIERGRGAAIGQWSVPGGRVESGEQLSEAVEREVLEETGMAVTCGEFIGWVERIDSTYHYVIMDFHAQLTETSAVGVAEPVAGDDASDVAWVPLDRLGDYQLVAGLETFLRQHGVLG